ncbi:MAG: FKBP-type peptidyl-prolyl cis-trans isomerase [Patescibacteria group bacterium]|nr:FKBP-type peptidyl-prolyl cis-trans isomerase [Patescibacteria group bacterium]
MPQRQIEGFTPVDSVTELKTEDLQVGAGAEAKAGDTVTVDYVGVLAKTGAGFDNSIDRGQPATFGLDQVIAGWQQGIPGMKEGGKRRLYIPAALAYGEQSPSALIPANSDLVFDVTLIKVGQ